MAFEFNSPARSNDASDRNQSLADAELQQPLINRLMDESSFAARTRPAEKTAPTFDPYQSLEEDTQDTKNWVAKQTDKTEKFLETIPERKDYQDRLEKAYDYEVRYDMWKQNGRYYMWSQQGLSPQPVLCMVENFQDQPKVIIDPNKFSTNGVTSVYQLLVSNDGRYASIDLSEAGQDKSTRKYFDIQTQQFVDKIPSGTDWPEFVPFQKRTDLDSFSSLSTIQNRNKHANDVIEDKDINKDKKAPWSAEGGGEPDPINIKLADGTVRTYTVSKDNSSMHKLLMKDSKSGKEIVLLPERADAKLEEVRIVGDKMVAHYLKDCCSELKLYDLDGKFIQDIQLPGRGTARNLSGIAGDDELIFSFSNYNTPMNIYRFDVGSLKMDSQYTPNPKFNPKDIEFEEKFYKTKDGTPVHMFLIHKKGMELNGKNPTYLYGYGGFNIDITPSFSTGFVPFLEDGGVIAITNLRGGGEYGEKWHEAGMLEKKQNVFDDFIAAAEYLRDNNYTSPEKLAIGGASNGGLLVSATLVQRPDLFKAAIPEVGLHDMLRYPKIGPGRWWIPEYGDPSKSRDYQNLLKYTPMHNLKKGTKYPAILTITGENDDRVLPAHSYKFVAAAQAAQGDANNPVLLYVGKDRGHGHGMTAPERMREYRDKWSFLKKVMGP